MSWKEIWDKKGSLSGQHNLEKLLEINGFTSDDKMLPIENWLQYVENISEKINLSPADKIFEAGCGAGAFLLPLYQKGYLNITGMDYAKSMVDLSQSLMPKAQFSVGNISNLSHFGRDSFDVVLCNSVFLYLDSLESAKKTISEFCQVLSKGGRGAILDIPDILQKETAIQAKREAVGEEAYHRLYSGSSLKHMYYEESWFEEISRELKISSSIEKQNIQGYTNSNYRFNFFFEKS